MSPAPGPSRARPHTPHEGQRREGREGALRLLVNEVPELFHELPHNLGNGEGGAVVNTGPHPPCLSVDLRRAGGRGPVVAPSERQRERAPPSHSRANTRSRPRAPASFWRGDSRTLLFLKLFLSRHCRGHSLGESSGCAKKHPRGAVRFCVGRARVQRFVGGGGLQLRGCTVYAAPELAVG